MPRRHTSKRRRAPRPHVYRGQAGPYKQDPHEVPDKRLASWNQWVDGWELPVYTAEQARAARLVTVHQIANRVQRTPGAVSSALRDSPKRPEPQGVLIDVNGQHHLLFAADEILKWARNYRPQWFSSSGNNHTERGDSTMAEYGQLGRSDLTTFDKEATGLILAAIAAGCVGNVSRKTHCILRNAAGQTMSVQRKLTPQNRAAQNTRAAYKRFMQSHTEALEVMGVTPKAEETEPEVAAPIETAWFCTLCQTAFPPSDRDAHMEVEHPKYTFCPECGALVKKQGLGPHINMAHRVTTEQRRENALKGAETRRRAREKAAGETIEVGPVEVVPEEPSAPAEEPVSTPVDQTPVEEPQEPQIEPEPIVVSVAESVRIVEQIRDLIGKDPRIAELEAQIVVLTEERDAAIKAKEDLEAKFALAKEAFGL